MNIATIIEAKPGHQIPREYAEKALDGVTVAGFAIQEDGKISTSQDDVPPALDDFLKFDEEIKDLTRTYYLGKFGPGFKADDIQPFVMRVGEKDTDDILAVFLEGDFPGYTNAESGHCEERNLMEEILLPSLMKNYKFCNGDLDKFFAELNDPLFKKNLLNTSAHRGVFHFVPIAGERISHGTNDLGGQYTWGNVSQTHGYAEAAPAPAETANTSTRRGWWNRGTKQGPASEEKAPAPINTEMVNDRQPENVQERKPDTAIPDKNVGVEYEEVSCPPTLHGKPRKAWIRKMLNLSASDKLPAGWKEPHFKIKVKKAKVINSLQELDKLPIKTVDKPAVVDKATAKDKPIQSAVDAGDKLMPVMSAGERKEVEDFLVKYLNGAEVTSNPLDIQKEEQKYPYWSEAMGRPFEEIVRMPISLLFALAEKKPKAVVLMLIEARRKWLEASGTKLSDLVGTEKPAEEKPPTITQSAANAVKAGAKRMSFNRPRKTG